MLITVPANKLENVDVDYISLVARGANRVPFRIIKSQEHGMINLTNLKTLLKKTAVVKKQELYGVVLPKALADNEQVMAAVAKAGIAIDKKVEKDGVVLLKQQDGEAGDKAVTLKLSDNVAIVLKGFYGMPEGADFNEILKTQGFYPGFSMATEALYMAVRNVLMDETTKSTDDAVKKVDSALDQFHTYVVSILSEVPPSAFKVEKAVADALEALDKTATEAAAVAATAAAAAAAAAAEIVVKAEAAAAAKAHMTDYRDDSGKCMAGYVEVAGKCVPEKKAEKEDLLKEIGASMTALLGDALKGVNKAVEEIGKTITGLTAKVDGITTAQTELKVQVTQAAESAKKAEAGLKGLTIGGIPKEDSKLTQRDTKETGGNFDTAFNPGVRKKASAYGSLIAERTRTQK